VKILVACEFSGIVRDAFRKRGHDAWSCDIIPCDGDNNYHYQCDVLKILDEGWDMMIAHPPCTYLSNAGAVHLYPKGMLNLERYEKGLIAKDFFVKLLNAPIEKICIENPIPSKIYCLPDYTQTIQPWEHGHPYSKKTCLWLKNLEPLQSTEIVPSDQVQSTKIAGNWFNKGGKDRQKNRAKTFTGIANAMADQWG